MLKINNYKKVTNIFITLLVSLKFITLVSKKNSVKSYQSFCFILLIYFMSASLRVFGIIPHIFDLTELILIVVFFIHCLYGPRILRS